MKRLYEFGDRVHVYDGSIRWHGTVSKVQENGLMIVDCRRWGGELMTVSLKQCRRLVKRKRREFWIVRYCTGSRDIHDKMPSFRPAAPGELIHVREVKP